MRKTVLFVGGAAVIALALIAGPAAAPGASAPARAATSGPVDPWCTYQQTSSTAGDGSMCLADADGTASNGNPIIMQNWAETPANAQAIERIEPQNPPICITSFAVTATCPFTDHYWDAHYDGSENGGNAGFPTKFFFPYVSGSVGIGSKWCLNADNYGESNVVRLGDCTSANSTWVIQPLIGGADAGACAVINVGWMNEYNEANPGSPSPTTAYVLTAGGSDGDKADASTEATIQPWNGSKGQLWLTADGTDAFCDAYDVTLAGFLANIFAAMVTTPPG